MEHIGPEIMIFGGMVMLFGGLMSICGRLDSLIRIFSRIADVMEKED